jgi:hypothetical protein
MKTAPTLAALLLVALCSHAAPNPSPLVHFTTSDFTGITGTATDRQGNVFICGVTRRPEVLPGPLVRIGKPRAGEYDAFVIKLRPDRTPVGTAIIGGRNYDAADRIAADSQGNVIISGFSSSHDFPVVNAIHPHLNDSFGTFICKLDASLSHVVFSTFVNGAFVSALTVDSANNVLAGGTANSGTTAGLFPPESGFWSDMFVLKLRPNGQKAYAKRLQADSGQITALAVDANGIACLVGQASSGNIPLLNALQPFKPAPEYEPNAFLARIDSDGQMISSTFLGGSCRDYANAVAVNAAGEIYVVGETSSDIIPAPAPGSVPSCGSLRRGFLVKLGADATNVIFSKVFSFGWHHNFSSIVVTPNDVAIAGGTISTLSHETGVPILARVTANGSTSIYFPNDDCGMPASINRLAMSSGTVLWTGSESRGRPTDWDGSFVKEISLTSLNQRQPRQVRIVPPHPFHFAPPELLGLAAVTPGFDTVDSITFFDGKMPLGTATNAPFTVGLPELRPGRHTFTAIAQGDGVRASSCPVRITVGSPRNDNFTNSIQITGKRARVRGTTAGATIEAGDAAYLGRHSVWYSWRPTREGAFQFRLIDDSWRAIGSVFTGNDLSQLTELGQFYAGGSNTVFCEVGKTYHIRIATQGDSLADFRLVIRGVERPPNDDFADAQMMSGAPASVSGTTAHATIEEGGTRFGNAVWYAWTAPAAGLYLASTTDGNGYISVFTGTTLSNLVSRGQTIYGLTNGSAFYAGASETYFLAVTWQSALPQFTLTIQEHQPPENDNFAQRILIPAGTSSATGSCIGATFEIGESPFTFFYGPSNSVWWSWIAPSSGVYRAEAFVPYPPPRISSGGFPLAARPGIGEVVSVYSGDALVALTSENDTSFYPGTTWRAEAGVEYQIKVSGGAALFTLDISFEPPPANDLFANAIWIDEMTQLRGTTTGAGLEPGEPPHDGSVMWSRASVWYRWLAPRDDLFVVDTQARVNIFTGETLSGLTRVSNAARIFRATAGTMYSFAVLDSQSFVLRVRDAAPPANDDFAQRQLLSGLSIDFTANLHDASVEPQEPNDFSSGTPTATVWYSWTPPVSGNYLLRATNISFLGLRIYTGESLTNLHLARYNHGYAAIDFQAMAGTTYHFSIDRQSVTWLEQFAMELRYRAAPPNDDFANRILLSGTNVSIVASNVGATVEPGEPDHSLSPGRQSVWFSWTAPATGRASFEISADVSLVLALYGGVDVTNLIALLPSDLYRRQFNFNVDFGETYQLAVDGFQFPPNSGTFTLNIRYSTPPPNDAFVNRLTITNNEVTGTLEGASREAGEPGYIDDPNGNSVWWEWIAPTNGLYKVQVQANETLEVAVFTGLDFQPLQKVAPPWETSSFYFAAQAGVLYGIQVGSKGGRYSDYKLLLQYVPPPNNDDFENRIPFTTSISGTLEGATHQPGEPTSHGETNSGSVWFTWTAPEDGRFELTETSYSYVLLAVYTGNTLSNLQGGFASWETAVFNATAGTAYAIQVSDYDIWSGSPFALSMQKTPAPPLNDEFVNRVLFTNSIAGTVRGATSETNEPYRGDGGSGSVWFTWVAPATGGYDLNLGPGRSSFSAHVYVGETLGDLREIPLDSSVPVIGGAQRFHAHAGSNYQVQLIGLNTVNATFALAITYRPGPANDDFANRTVLSGASFAVSGTTALATQEDGEPFWGRNSVWYSWTPQFSGTFQANVLPVSNIVNHRLDFFLGDSVNTAGHLGGTYSPLNTFTMPVTAGTEFQIRVTANSYTSHDFAFTITNVPAQEVTTDPVRSTAVPPAAKAGHVTGSTATTSGLRRLIEFTAEQQTRIQGTVIDDAGNIFVHGDTADPRELPGPQVQLGPAADTRQIFLLKLAADGTPLGAVTFGGNGINLSSAIAIDSAGRVVMAGTTTSTNFSLKNALLPAPFSDANVFVCKFDMTGTNLLFSTLYGGSGYDSASSVAIAADGSVFVSGVTGSEDFPATTRIAPFVVPNSSYAFVLKLNFDERQNATLDYATLVGGSAGQTVKAMTVDATGHAYVAGETTSYDFPVVNALQSFPPSQNFSSIAYVAKLTPDGAGFVYSTYLAGECQEHPQSIAVNAAGEAVVVGATCSPVIPALAPASDPSAVYSGWAAFAVKLSADGTSILDQRLRGYSRWDEFKTALPLTNGSVLLVGGIHTYQLAPGFAFTTELSSDGFSQEQLLTSGCDERIGLQAAAINSAGQLVLAGLDVDRSTPSQWHTWVAAVTSRAPGPHVRIVEPANGAIIPPNYGAYLVAAAVGFSNEVTSMEFYEGTNLIGVATNAPFQINVSGNSAATRSFWAKASSGSESATSCVGQIIQKSPRNDNFARRRRLFSERVRVRGTTQGATTEPSDPSTSSSVWYSWRAPRDGTFEFSVTPDERMQMIVFTGTNLNQLSVVSDWLAPTATLRVQRGTRYQIRVGSGHFGDSEFELTIRRVNPPPNDDFANAVLIAGTNVSVKGTLLHATHERNEGIYFSGVVSVWYRWQAPSDGLFFAEATAEGLIPQVAVYQGDTPYPWFTVSQPVSGVRSGASFPAEQGVTYWLSVYGYGSSYSNFTLTITGEPPPSNDHFDNRITISGAEVSAMGSTLGSTNAGWFSWTAPTSGVYRIAAPLVRLPQLGGVVSGGVPPSPWPGTQLTVFTGNALDALTFITGGDVENGAILRATAGDAYLITIRSGLSLFELRIHPVEPPSNDDYANPTLLNSGTPVIVTGSTRNATPEPGSTYTGATVWYRWTAPSNGLFTVQVLPGYNAAWIYSGSDLASAELLYSGQRPLIRATAGEEFRIGVPDTYSSGGAFVLRIEQLVAVANDDFVNSEILVGTNIQFTAHVRNATVEPDEYYAGGASVWFSWTAPFNGQFSLRFTTPYSAAVRVFVGDALTNLLAVASSDLELHFNALAGTTYRFQVDDAYHYNIDFALELSHVQPPSNDSFANRIHFSGVTVSTSGTLRGATIEPNEPNPVGPTFRESVWWSWTAPRTGRAQIDSSRSCWTLAYTGDSLESLTQVAAGTGLDFSVEAGVTYQIAVADDIGSTPGDFQLQITLLDVPSNDNFANRHRIIRRARGTTDGASREDVEPYYSFDPTGGSVWYVWRAPRNGVYDLVLTGGSATTSTIYTGIRLDELAELEETAGGGQMLRFHATRGTSYIIEISNPNNSGGPYQLEIIRRRPPSNDDFANRIRLTGTNFTVRGNNAFATTEPSSLPDCFDDPQRSLWWKWTPPTSGAVFIQFEEAVTRFVGFYAGNGLDELECVATGEGSFNFDMVAGVELQIAVGLPFHSSDADEPWRFQLLLIPPPTNDNFAARTPLAGANVHTTGTFVGASTEAGELDHSVWWLWVVPETGSYTFRLRATNTWPNLQLYSGSDLDDLDFIALAPNRWEVAEVSIALTTGEELAILAGGWFEAPTDQFELTIVKVPTPANDDFANRAELINGRGIGDNEGASAEPGEPGTQYDRFGTLWWRFTAASNGWHVIGAWLTNSANEWSAMRAWLLVGDSVTNLYVVLASGRHYEPRYFLTAGDEYSIQVSDPEYRLGAVAVEVHHIPSPANDFFTSAMPIVGEHASILASNGWATLEVHEPATFYPWIGASVWWRWTPAEDGVYSLTLEPGYSHYVGVYTGTTLSNLTDVHRIAYGAQGNGYLFRARGGVEHYFRVASDAAWEGPFLLQFDRVQPPANDNFTNRTALTGSHIWIDASNYFATPEVGDPLVSSLGEQTVWWSWVALASETVSVRVVGYYYEPTQFRVFTGSQLTNLVAVTNISSVGSPFTFNAEPGVEYQIGITTYSYYAARFALRLDVLEQPPEPSAMRTEASVRVSLPATRQNVIETSTDLLHWQPYRTNAPGASEILITPRTDEPQRFFRVR